MNDDELVRRARAGSHDAFDALVRRYDGRLYNMLRRRFNDADAEDIAQRTFIRAWQSLDRYNHRWRFATWLYAIGWRIGSNDLRSNARRHRHVRHHAAHLRDHHAARSTDDPAAQCAAREANASIWALADCVLDEEAQLMLWLRYVEELTPMEVGRVIGRSAVSVRVRLHRARRTLAAAWAAPDAATSPTARTAYDQGSDRPVCRPTGSADAAVTARGTTP